MTNSLTTPRGMIAIRAASPADAMEFRELRLGALRDHPIEFGADYQKNLQHPPKYWEDMLSMQVDESTIFLAEHEKNLVGMTGIARGGSPKTRHSAVVWGVYVKPEWRGLHIAEEMINACLAWARTRNIVIAKLGVAAINTSAISCYERCGFKAYGTEPRATFYDGQYYDGLLMSRSLDDSESQSLIME
ncbi:MAG TPA: GNAT family N-acetyltransferase [Anaerolineales bacterium]|nr:GNAT family N-acetyltransferase [Anaerolineales bacterium]HLO28776.1 GNAT family N-acetyltransferase [Anaerolineales bacterium]